MTLLPAIEDLTAQVDAELNDILVSRDMPLYQMMAYHLGWDKKGGNGGLCRSRDRTRGILCLLACHAAGGDMDLALSAAAAVELVHNFCQIHDDVQGGNPQRHDRDAVWWVWGPAQAINVGDGMHAMARLALLRLLNRGVSVTKTFRAVHMLDEASLQTCEGRFLDLEAQGARMDGLSVNEYLTMSNGKTGAMFSCAMGLGGLLATDDTCTIGALEECGSKLGLAIQISRDIVDLWGDGTDQPSIVLMNKKKLFPLVYAFEKANINQKRRLDQVFFKRVLEHEDVAKVRELVDELGVRKDCDDIVEKYLCDAKAALEVPGISPEGRLELVSLISAVS